jgi:protein TonB
VALKQLVKRVDPTVPLIAVNARIGGTVTLDIVVGLKGTVEDARIVSSANPLLNEAALVAVRQWVFTPLVVKGKPTRAQVLVDVDFAIAARVETQDAYSAAWDKCQRASSAGQADAVAVCEALGRLADNLPVDRWRMKAEALSTVGNAHLLSKDVQGALRHFEQALHILMDNSPSDVDVANLHAIVGFVHVQALAFEKADGALSKALDLFDQLVSESPGLLGRIRDNLDQLLAIYSSVKRIMGDTAAAAALDARRSSLAQPPLPSSPPGPRRLIGSVPCFGDECADLTENSLDLAAKSLPARSRIWMVFTGEDDHIPTVRPGPAMTVYMEPSISTPDIRRGRIVTLFQRKRADRPSWEALPMTSEWAQIPAGRIPAELSSPADPQWPFAIDATRGPAPANADVLAIVAAIRTAGERSRQAGRSNVRTDVQPWTIANFHAWPGGDRIDVLLRDPVLPRPPQPIVLERQSGEWKIVAVGRIPLLPVERFTP